MSKRGHDFATTMWADKPPLYSTEQQKNFLGLLGQYSPRYHREFLEKVMVWAAIALFVCRKHLLIEGTLTREQYMAVFQKFLFPGVKNRKFSLSFQQDGATLHKAQGTTKWLRSHNVLKPTIPWPVYSPDLSPNEKLWGIMHNDVTRCWPPSMS